MKSRKSQLVWIIFYYCHLFKCTASKNGGNRRKFSSRKVGQIDPLGKKCVIKSINRHIRYIYIVQSIKKYVLVFQCSIASYTFLKYRSTGKDMIQALNNEVMVWTVFVYFVYTVQICNAHTRESYFYMQRIVKYGISLVKRLTIFTMFSIKVDVKYLTISSCRSHYTVHEFNKNGRLFLPNFSRGTFDRALSDRKLFTQWINKWNLRRNK